MALPWIGPLAAAAGNSTAKGIMGKPPIKACILIFYYGGPSHFETWDPKPHAPAEVRGEFKTIATSVPGVQISEHLPFCSRLVDRLALVRSMHHPMRNHNSAAVEALCGRTPLRGDLELLSDDELSFPCYGSSLAYAAPRRQAELPAVALPHVLYNVVQLPGQTAGFLGAAHQPFQIAADPNAADFSVAALNLPLDVPLDRLTGRRSLASRLDSEGSSAPTDKRRRNMQAYYDRAFALLRSEPIRRGLDLNRETPKLRERYGRNTLGQSMLLARRLVEAGVRFVSVFDKVHNGQDANWDSHEQVFVRSRDHLLPPADRAFSALIEDLQNRGLLDSTLVIGLGEFGRTPKINKNSGRDHWPDCFSVVLAGGGIRGGTIHGASDRIGAYPDRDGVTPGDLAATIFARFGLDPGAEIRDQTNRPYRLADGEPIRGLFA